VGLRLYDDEAEARSAHHGGVHRLLLLRLADKLKYVGKNHRLSQQAALAWTRVEDVGTLERALAERVVGDRIDDAWAVRDAAALDALEARLRPAIVDHARKAIDVLDTVVLRWHEVRRRLDDIGPAQPSAQADIESQLDDLVYPSFVADIASERLAHYPRYLDAIDARLEALELDPRRDVQRQAEIDPWWQHYLDHLAEGHAYTDTLDRYRWLVEEYRVQVFAQQLGTAEKVSKKRLEDAWTKVVDERNVP
jgi:ATP-dependent helicase HrpA